jgi:hypothetical protein
MNRTRIDTGRVIEVQGRPYPVWLDEHCQFRADIDGHGEVIAPSWNALEDKAREYRDQRFELAITVIDSGGIKNGTITGFHARTGQLLIRWDGTQGVQQVQPYHLDTAMPRLAWDDTAVLISLLDARRKAQQELDSFTAARKFPTVIRAAQAAQRAQREAILSRLASGGQDGDRA